MENVKEINEGLKREFGKNLRGEANFRVSWSNTQTEVRRREYNEFHGELFVRTVRETSECLKYPLIRDRWIIEMWVAPNPVYTDEIVSAREKGSYECIYIFQDKDGQYLPVNELVARIVIKAILNPNEVGQRTDTSDSAALKEGQKDAQKIDEAVAEFYDEFLSKNMKYPDGSNASKGNVGIFPLNNPTVN